MILEAIAAEKIVTLEHLVGLLNSSESTVRRDLDELEAERKLRRIHGGAEALTSSASELSNLEKSVKNVQEKMLICQKALNLIDEGDVVFIDAGTTTGVLVKALSQEPVANLTVVTNSIHHAATFVEQGIKTIIIGGLVKERTDASIGGFALEQIESLNFDKAFIGMNGVDKEYLTTPDPEEATIKKAIIANAKDTFVLADESKLGQFSFVKVASLNQVTLLTNRTEKTILQEIKKKTRVIEV
ncbi:DeoR/GlpR family DNA-binding transcription regulator [Streptococcus moroccensis]|uniref:DeoR family fructose operon transcriptional repressor n=1 Tax=Streptococcus moroccensis TaxID=1451356 RepID=A0ABT9YUW2_9STRE|nr:DeoR/GlpR family DNA-binding transcription regulator [Streptococcus moroccensis]MDQ0223519.1 DeoR family fructose operon transcriptional repressor [Streptococcus moroccensis]